MSPAKSSRQATVEAIIAGMAKRAQDPLSGQMSLKDDLGYDSLRLIELMIAIEQKLSLPPTDLELAVTVSTVDDVIRLVLGSHGTQIGAGTKS